MKLINQKGVKEFALAMVEDRTSGKRDRVSKSFLLMINEDVKAAIYKRTQHHDNRIGSRKTLI